MGPEYTYREAGSTLSKAETAPESDVKVIRQQVIGLADNIREARVQLECIADRFWGCVPTDATAKSPGTEECGDTLRGIHQVLDEARAELVQLRRVTSRFERLA